MSSKEKEKNEKFMERIVALAKQRGIVFPGSEIYGGLSNTWDFGPIGAELKNNVKKIWWRYFIQEQDDMVGLDASIFMNPKVWEASGHVSGFNDALVDCKDCKTRIRADHLIEDNLGIEVAGKSNEELNKIIKENNLKCPNCNSENLTEARIFNLMFKTYQGVTEDSSSLIYLRPETAQGIFVNFKNVVASTRRKLPFGIGQVGKAFRNEITPGNFIFRTREFEQMEIEYFIKPKDDWQKKFKELQERMWGFYVRYGVNEKNLKWRKHTNDELSHYSKMTYDIDYKFPFGWKELDGIAYRTDFDLAQHQKFSGEDMTYFDVEANEKYLAHCIEPTFGVERNTLIFLLDAYTEEEVKSAKGEKETRIVLKLHKDLAPYKVAVLPLSKKEELSKVSKEIWKKLRSSWMTDYDETQSIGRRYRRQDEIGTPYCVTIDFDSLEDKAVTVRDRDSMKQDRIKIEELENYLKDRLNK